MKIIPFHILGLIALRFLLKKTFAIILNIDFMTQTLVCQQPVSLSWGFALCIVISVCYTRKSPVTEGIVQTHH